MPTDDTTTETTSWKPIDTVPHDSPVLVYTKPWGAIIATYSSEHAEWLSRMQVPVSIKADEELPTHWQPLPEAPPGVSEDEAAAKPAGDKPAVDKPVETATVDEAA